jgi:hypothetical protein
MLAVPGNPVVYEERRKWTVSTAVTLAVALLLALAFLVGGTVAGSVWLLLSGVLFMLGVGSGAWSVVRQRLALRADEQGIVLAPPTFRARTHQPIPWPEVQSIIAYEPGTRAVLGVVKKCAGIPPASLTPGGLPQPDVSVRVANWALDLPRLASTVHAYAPEVTVFDERGVHTR